LDLLKELADDYGPIFNQHVQRYCEDNQIDIASLEKRRGLSVSVQKSKENHQADKLLEDKEMALMTAGEHFVGEEPELEPIETEQKEIDEIHDIFKRLFKKLAVHLHPDRVMGLTEQEREDRLEMFKEAKQALDEERYFFLLDLSDRFKIRLPKNYRQQTRWMKNKIKQLDQKIKAQQGTYNFAYAECETEEEKEKLVKMFLKQLYGI
jgi:DnaJ-domain-containing protein 1